MIGVKINGMKKIGFNISGVLNKIGLFILKNVGIIEVWLIVWLCLDFVNYMNMNGIISVVLVLFMVMINICVLEVRILLVCIFCWRRFKLILVLV